MKTLSIFMSFLFAIMFSPTLEAQICYNDTDYYHHHKTKHYKKTYRHDRKSIINFKKRIDDGVWSGELTRREEKKLKHKLNKLINYKNKAYRDGYISHRERRHISGRELSLDKQIYKEKHDRQRRH